MVVCLDPAKDGLGWTNNNRSVIPIGMDKSDIVLGISIIGVALAAIKVYRDRSCVKAKSKFYPACSEMPPHILVEAVNTGRRPLILNVLGGKYIDGNLMNFKLGKDGQGIQLGENEPCSVVFEQHLFNFGKHCSALGDLWLEDTTGRHYSIKGAKRHLEMYFNSVQ